MTRNRFVGLLLALTGLLPAAAQAQSAAQKPAAPVVARVAVASNFADAAKQLAAAYGKQSGHRIEVSAASTGNALLATAGTGDVLAGLIGAHMAAGQSAAQAASAAVYLHGCAADCWPAGNTLTAGALARCAGAFVHLNPEDRHGKETR